MVLRKGPPLRLPHRLRATHRPLRRRWNNLNQVPRLLLRRPTQPSSRLADWELPLKNLIQAKPSALITQCPSLSISNRD